ncbi:hypothetical protein BH20ACI3_BH20ACI3_38470 [soil metagenome]
MNNEIKLLDVEALTIDIPEHNLLERSGGHGR